MESTMRYLKAYEWTVPHGVQSAGIVPFLVVNMFWGHTNDDMDGWARELARRGPGERAMLTFWLLSKEIRLRLPDVPERGDLDPLTVFENGINIEPSLEWLRPLAEKFRQHGVVLDVITADVEDGFTLHQIMPAWEGDAWERELSRIYDSPAAYARMPADLRRLRPRDFSPWTVEGRKACDVFNRYGARLLTEAIREIFIGSKMFHDAKGRQPYKISNWMCMRPSFPLTDGNRWEIPPVAVDATSSPALYLGERGGLYQGRPHEPLWCGFVHLINIARSCLGTQSGHVLPWISSPRLYVRDGPGGGGALVGYDETNVWLWRELMAHLVRSGCREFLFWNDDSDRGRAHRMLAETMRANDRPYSRRPLPELPLDVDEVTTRGYTTKYSDLLAELGKPK